MLDKGVDINAKTDRGETPGMLAATHGRKYNLELLLSKGAYARRVDKLPLKRSNTIQNNSEVSVVVEGILNEITVLIDYKLISIYNIYNLTF
jgi:ankyrin repeat protein